MASAHLAGFQPGERISEAELKVKVQAVEKETRRQRVEGEINQRTEREILSKFGISMRDDTNFPCKYLAEETFIRTDSREINKLLLKLKFGYSKESVALIEKHVLENREKARKRGGKYSTTSVTLDKIIGMNNIPPTSFYHPYQNDMIKQCWDELEKSDPVSETTMQDFVAKSTAFTYKRGIIDKNPAHII